MLRLSNNLHVAVSAVCRIDGVSVGRKNDKSTWRIDFRPETTIQQRIDAQTIINNFDIDAELRKPELTTLEERIKAIEIKLGI